MQPIWETIWKIYTNGKMKSVRKKRQKNLQTQKYLLEEMFKNKKIN